MDLLELEAELVRQHLAEDGLVALAVVVRAHGQRHRARRVEADLRPFRRPARRLLDDVGDADPAQFPARAGLGPPAVEARVVDHVQRHVHVLFELAGIVIEDQTGLERQRVFRDVVAPPDLRRVDPQLRRGGVDHALDGVGRLGPARAAIGPGRGGVGEHAGHVGVDRGRLVRPGQRAEVVGRGMRPEQREVGAEIGDRGDAECEERPVLVQRELGGRDVVARLVVGHEALGAVAGPLHGSAQLLRRVEAKDVLAIGAGSHAERAAHVVADHAQLVLRHMQDRLGHRLSHAVRALGAGIERVALLELVVLADAGARLHRRDGDAADGEIQGGDVIGLLERRVGRRLVALLEDEADIVRALVPDGGRAVLQRVRGVRDRGQGLVVDLDQLGGVARLGVGLGDHEGGVVADQADAVLAQRRVGRREHGRAVGLVARHGAGNVAEPGGRDIDAGIDRENARRRLRRRGVDRGDPGVRVRRANHESVRLTGAIDVIGIPAAAAQQPRVFPPGNPLSDAEFGHVRPLCLFVRLLIFNSGSSGAAQLATPEMDQRVRC